MSLLEGYVLSFINSISCRIYNNRYYNNSLKTYAPVIFPRQAHPGTLELSLNVTLFSSLPNNQFQVLQLIFL